MDSTKDTENYIARTFAELLVKHGITRAVVSPGSRNTPLLIALSRKPSIATEVVVDERSAGFMALGLALVSQKPVVLICTSGSALLNYAPAVAEAYYRRIPLVVVSADRPKEWIDQDDSQTIVQPGALSNYVKRSYDLSVDRSEADRWYANRLINDALLATVSGRQAPVHINIQFDNPLGRLQDSELFEPRVISMLEPEPRLSEDQLSRLSNQLASTKKVMVIAGFLPPCPQLNSALRKLAALPNFVVLTETISNLSGPDFVSYIDSTLAAINPSRYAEFHPDIVISLGGALVSRHIKQFLRENKLREHWHVGVSRTTIDCFQSLTLRVEMNPSSFFPLLADSLSSEKIVSDYATQWEVAARRALSLRQSFASKCEWSDFKAFSTLIPLIPKNWNVQYSNGTSIRYAQIFGDHAYHRCDCNRGVSGIDGCTSTAIGSSLDYEGVTLLISGDMSAQYDIGALASQQISPRFKMIIMDNEGGGIFRFIPSTANLDIRDRFHCVPGNLNWKAIAEAFGLSYFDVRDEDRLRTEFPLFRDLESSSALMVIHTPGQLSADILNQYFEFNKTN